MKDDRFDLEGELRAGRPEPRADFATALAGEVRGAKRRLRQGRMGLTLAMTGLIIVAVVSFGGVGYASSSKPAAVKHASVSAAQAQYKTFTPPKAKPKAKPKAQVAAQTKSVVTAPKKAQLPFTGLALWIPLAIGLMLIAFGVVLRTRGRKHGPTAH
jgi:amino acid transporter